MGGGRAPSAGALGGHSLSRKLPATWLLPHAAPRSAEGDLNPTPPLCLPRPLPRQHSQKATLSPWRGAEEWPAPPSVSPLSAPPPPALFKPSTWPGGSQGAVALLWGGVGFQARDSVLPPPQVDSHGMGGNLRELRRWAGPGGPHPHHQHCLRGADCPGLAPREPDGGGEGQGSEKALSRSAPTLLTPRSWLRRPGPAPGVAGAPTELRGAAPSTPGPVCPPAAPPGPAMLAAGHFSVSPGPPSRRSPA